MPPLVAWAAVTGGLSGMAFYLFAIVFFWTPPHFWALSLLMKDEYAKAGVPMLPVVRGEAEPLCSGRDGLKTLQVVDAVLQSARTGRTVAPEG